MADHIGVLSRVVGSKLRTLGFPHPQVPLIRAVLERVYLASLKTEEGRHVRGSLTFADPTNPDADPPPLRRAQYPGFTSFARQVPLTTETVAKLSRAIDQWSGSIAIHGTTTANLVAWGVVDQIVHSNVLLHHESATGMANPGVFAVIVDGVGALSVYHCNLFLGGLRQDQLVRGEHDALRHPTLRLKIAKGAMPVAQNIVAALGTKMDVDDVLARLLDEWSHVVARLCIGLRRLGTGGAFLISPAPLNAMLDASNGFPYQRLSIALALGVLDKFYERDVRNHIDRAPTAVPHRLVRELSFAETDADDRAFELTGAVRLVTTLAAIDGLVLMTPSLQVVAFGVKIKSSERIGSLYDAADFSQRGARARLIDPSRFGTRHGSVFQYCRADRQAVGVIVSQDGQVRLVLSEGRSLTLWENVQLLRYNNDVRQYASHLRRRRRDRKSNSNEQRLGYSSTPKTMKALMTLDRASPPSNMLPLHEV